MNNRVLLVLLCSVFSLLAGCNHYRQMNFGDEQAMSKTSVVETNVASYAGLVKTLEGQHVQVIAIGDTVSLLFYADRYFAAGDDLLLARHFSSLDAATALINNYGDAAVKIAVSTDDVDSDKRSHTLSQRRAQRIAAYLWQHGISVKRLFPMSYGKFNKLASNHDAFASQQNRRIEITFNSMVSANDFAKQMPHFLGKKQPWQLAAT